MVRLKSPFIGNYQVVDSDPTGNADPTMYTNDANVFINMAPQFCYNPDTILISEDSEFDLPTTYAFSGQTQVGFTLSAGEGSKTVFTTLGDIAGNGIASLRVA